MVDKEKIGKEIKRITDGLSQDNFKNEAEVSQGIVSALLNVLGWNAFDVNEVTREYSTENGRVDYALCNKPRKPFLFIEVKAVGKAQSDGEEQLFRYAFDEGVPMLILTDGREWGFYLTTEQGRFYERQFYKLDLLERSLDDCIDIFCKFLHRHEIVSGKAKETAQTFFKSKKKDNEIKDTLPEAWKKLLEEPDELLVELLVEKVQAICGHSPDAKMAGDFLKSEIHSYQSESISLSKVSSSEKYPMALREKHTTRPTYLRPTKSPKIGGIRYKEKITEVRTALEGLERTLSLFAKEDPNFLLRLKSVTETKHRNWVSKDKRELYKSRPDFLAKYKTRPLPKGWWMGCNISQGDIEKRIRKSCELFGVSFGKGKDFEILYQKN